MSKDKKNNSSAPQKRASWFKRLFLGGSKTYADEVLSTDKYGQRQVSDLEAIDSPTKQIVKRFIEKKYAVVALILLVLMFLIAFVGPLFLTKYSNGYSETTQKNIYPTMSMMSVPNELKGDIKQISSYGPFTVGLSNAGKVYVWGCTALGTTGIDVANIPEEVKNANIVMVGAGLDHIIAIDENGKIYGWGDYAKGQYGISSEYKFEISNYCEMPEEIYRNGVDIANVKKLLCANQVTAILMNDGTLYIWGNGNSYGDLLTFSTMNKFAFFEPILLDDIAFTGSSIIAIRRAPEDGSDYEPIYMGTSSNKSFTSPKKNYTDELGTPIAEILAEHSKDGEQVTIKNVYGGYESVIYQLSDNTLYFGGSFKNQTTSFVAPPELADDEHFVDIQGGIHHFGGITNKGNVYTWGEDLLNQCTTPATVEKADKFFACGFQTYTVDENGNLLQCWGNKGYLFGTDTQGRNLFHRIIIGSKTTMTVGGVAVIISTIIGIIIGCIAGYFGGKVDIVLMRVAEIFSAIPFLPFAMMLSSLTNSGWAREFAQKYGISLSDPYVSMAIIMFILGLLSWSGLARLVRGQVLVARENEYVTAAKAMGVKESKIAFKHILPNVISVILVTLTLDFASCMLTESSLSYLGFGVQGEPTWGNMLTGVFNMTIVKNYWWQWFFTALFLATTTICINIIGDALRDVMDPKSSAER